MRFVNCADCTTQIAQIVPHDVDQWHGQNRDGEKSTVGKFH